MYSDNRGVEPQASGEVQTSLYPRVTREEELERQPGHIVDLMATAVDLGNATYPDTVEDLSEKHPERLEKMTQQWDSAARHFNAVPWPYGGECGTEEDK